MTFLKNCFYEFVMLSCPTYWSVRLDVGVVTRQVQMLRGLELSKDLFLAHLPIVDLLECSS